MGEKPLRAGFWMEESETCENAFFLCAIKLTRPLATSQRTSAKRFLLNYLQFSTAGMCKQFVNGSVRNHECENDHGDRRNPGHPIEGLRIYFLSHQILAVDQDNYEYQNRGQQEAVQHL